MKKLKERFAQFIWGAVLLGCVVPVAQANDEVALAEFDKALVHFQKRESATEVELAIKSLIEAEKQVEDIDLKYDILILASRTYYWKGAHLKADSDKIAIFSLAMSKAKAAQGIYTDYAEAYYYYAISLGRWAEANGILDSLIRKNDLIKAAEDAMTRITRQGAAGETIDGFGPARTLGRAYFKLPVFAGGARDLALTYLNKAYSNAPTLALNGVYLAEVLMNGNVAEKNQAKAILDAIILADPNTFNPNRIPETKDEIEVAKLLRRQMGN